MSPPNKPSDPRIVYDDVEGVCRFEEPPQVCEAPQALPVEESLDRYAGHLPRSQILHETFSSAARRRSSVWDENPLTSSLLGLPLSMAGLAGCGGSPDQPVAPGDPISFVEPLGGEVVMNPAPLTGNLNEWDLSGSGERTAVA